MTGNNNAAMDRKSSPFFILAVLSSVIFLVCFSGCILSERAHSPGEIHSQKTIRLQESISGSEYGMLRHTPDIFYTPQTPTPPTCPYPVNATPWIHLEPVADHSVGENFSLKGTTNLNSGEELSIFVYQSPPSPNKKLPSEYTDVRGVALVSAGDCGINVWSFSENLTTLRPSLYTTQVRAANNATIEANLVQFYIVGDRIVAS